MFTELTKKKHQTSLLYFIFSSGASTIQLHNKDNPLYLTKAFNALESLVVCKIFSNSCRSCNVSIFTINLISSRVWSAFRNSHLLPSSSFNSSASCVKLKMNKWKKKTKSLSFLKLFHLYFLRKQIILKDLQ